jgi:hypothetical protein
LLKYVFIGDGTQQANTTLIDVSTLANSLNANGYIMTSNTDPKSTYRTTIKRIWGNYSGTGYVKLQWHGTSNGEIVVFGNGKVDIDFESRSDTAVITNPEANTSGDILISTSGVGSSNVFTIFVDLRKDNADYDAGQSRDPAAFNAGSYAGRNT